MSDDLNRTPADEPEINLSGESGQPAQNQPGQQPTQNVNSLPIYWNMSNLYALLGQGIY